MPDDNFNPRSPRGERLSFLVNLRDTNRFQSTLPARGATRNRFALAFYCLISIHAPREGSDRTRRHMQSSFRPFQSTLPARGATKYPPLSSVYHIPFQSTLPARGATKIGDQKKLKGGFQSTLPARGATVYPVSCANTSGISIHAPREGSDYRHSHGLCLFFNFNPRSPRWERRHFSVRISRRLGISIHAPREGSDRTTHNSARTFLHFNPRSPRGERRTHLTLPSPHSLISIHAPREGSDKSICSEEAELNISIHAPREGSDVVDPPAINGKIDFNPRSPRGERRLWLSSTRLLRRISIHAPREGSDRG